MLNNKLWLLIGLIQPALSLWSCSSDQDCASLQGSVCDNGVCVCPVGTQVALGGTLCAPVAPYHTSPCVEDFQCSRLFSGFECRRAPDANNGTCNCQNGHHFYLGRCWPTSGFGERCTRDAECLSIARDPNSMVCEGVCRCAPGYYERQRGECRRAGFAVGDGCVLNEDCQGANLSCNPATFTCFDVTASNETEEASAAQGTYDINKMANAEHKMEELQHGVACGVNNTCESPLECSTFGICLCPIGYYINEDRTMCLAELGSPSTEEQCAGIFSVVVNGTCTCPANFFYQESMRDCVKVARFITDSCLSDVNCHTFGEATVCGAEAEWGLRFCECVPELAVWDRDRNMCRLFAGLGEACEEDSDCLAGELEIQCQKNEQGYGVCACPEGYVEFRGLCITTGLQLGDACQVTEECTATENTVCENGTCSCDYGYQAADGICAPIIGGSCLADSDCVVENTICRNDSNTLTCQCDDAFVEYSDICWPKASGFDSACNITKQCQSPLGDGSACVDGRCACTTRHHYRDGGCWRMTGLFEDCSRSSECYLGDVTDRVVCRNSICQCAFEYPFSQELNTCTSAASAVKAGFIVIAVLSAMFLK